MNVDQTSAIFNIHGRRDRMEIMFIFKQYAGLSPLTLSDRFTAVASLPLWAEIILTT